MCTLNEKFLIFYVNLYSLLCVLDNILLIIQAQMVRRVKAYLSKLQVVTDEEHLRNMSLECEGGPEGHKGGTSSSGQHNNDNNNNGGSSSAPPTNPPPRRRPNSPTPSTTSSTSSTSQTSDGKKQTAKFGKTI